MNIFENAPQTEPERQYYFIDIAKDLLKKEEEKAGRKLTFHVTTFGCQMNARDSEKLSGILERIGYIKEESEKADFVVYNTCTVRENADNRVYGRLGILNGYKKKNPFMRIALCGCMMQEENVVRKIKESYSFVDIMFGTHNIHELAELVVANLQTNAMTVHILDHGQNPVENLPIDREYKFKTGIT